MTPEVKKWVRDFLDDDQSYKYPQPVVAEAINEKQTSLNTWRKDGVLWGGGWEKNGRLMYTGSGVIAAGMMTEFAWHFGPKKAAELVSGRINWIMDLKEDTELRFLDEVAFSTRTGLIRVRTSVGDHSSVREYDDTDGFLSHSTLREVAERDMKQGSIVIFPLGALVAKWALRTLSIMDRGTEGSPQD
ncbi:hypothetical protein [Roseovarius sp.]|uniref:hypothetical protein n=1 Tax=Roseovarius sp. TaxID=1486281 RepID=UPI002637FA7F|nr:hypothetical protein [Roseovarius sp.]MDM8167142.1 hypothetical protein [Roseovarius sp.]